MLSLARNRAEGAVLPHGWPLLGLLALYPVWWAVGLGPFAALLLAIPMAWQLLGRRRLVVPRGTGFLVLFLVFVLASVVMLGKVAPGTSNGNTLGTLIAYAYRLGSFAAALVVLVYVASSDERRLPTRRVVNALAILFVVTVAGGWLGVLFPRGAITSPVELVMPGFVRANDFAKTIIHPAFSQVQSVLGYAEGRPKAPFEYSNGWGSNFSLLLPFFLLAVRGARRRWVKLAGAGVFVAALVPVVLSLNRGLWIALGISVVFATVHLLRVGRPGLVIGSAIAAALLVVVFVVSPLLGVVSERLAHPHSNKGRAFLYGLTVRGAIDSPLLGWGGPRQTVGSTQGGSAGRSAKCAICGQAPVGTQGTFWTVLFSTGFVALGLLLAFLLSWLGRALRMTDPLAAAVALVLVLVLFEQFIYDQLPISLIVAMTGIGLLVRRSAPVAPPVSSSRRSTTHDRHRFAPAPVRPDGPGRLEAATAGAQEIGAAHHATAAADIQHLGRGSTLKIIGAGANTVFSLTLIVIVSRGYSLEKAGTFFAATTLFLLVGQAAEIGADEAMLRFIPIFRVSGRRDDVPRLVARVLKPVAVSATCAGAAALLFAPLLGRALADGANGHTVTTLLRILLPFIPVIALGEVVLAGTRGFQRMGTSVLVYDVGLSAMQAVLPLLARVIVGPSVVWLVVAWVAPYLFVLVAGALSLQRMLQQEGPTAASASGPSDAELVPGYWRFVGPRAAARLCQYGLRRIDVVLVAALSGPRDAAIYTAITRFVTVGTVGVQAVQQVAQPKLGELIHLRDHRRSLEVFRTSTIWLMVVSWPVYALFGVFSAVLLRSFGHGYTSGASALALLCASQLVTVATGPVDVALIMAGRSGTSMVNQMIALALDIALCVALIPAFGVGGAAVARVVALQWNNLVPGVQVYRSMGLHPFSRASTWVGAAALLGVGGIASLVRCWHGQNLPSFLFASVVGGVAYGAVLVVIRRAASLDVLVGSLLRRGGGRRAATLGNVLPEELSGQPAAL